MNRAVSRLCERIPLTKSLRVFSNTIVTTPRSDDDKKPGGLEQLTSLLWAMNSAKIPPHIFKVSIKRAFGGDGQADVFLLIDTIPTVGSYGWVVLCR